VSTVVVIESDTLDAEAWCAAHLPPTPMMTQSARGFHRYFRLPDALRADASCLPPVIHTDVGDVELKRDGQYVVAPGSVHPSGHVYAMVEDWPTSLDDVPPLPPIVLGASAHAAAKPALPDSISGGTRNNTLWTEACRLRRLGLDADEILGALKIINRKRCHPPIADDELKQLSQRAAKYQPAADTFPLTEAGDAEFFASAFGDVIRYDHRLGRWLLFNGHVWAPQTDGEVPRLTLEAMRARQRASVGIKDRLQWAAKGESRSRLGNLLAIAQTTTPIADAGEHWDEDPMLLGVANGILDLRTGTLRDGRPDDRITMRCAVAFDPAATWPAWERFLIEVFDDEDVIRYVQRACGYSLTGDCREECLFFCWGVGANGKGTLMNTLAWTLGDYADDLPFSALELHDRRSGISNDIAKLVSKRYVTASESGETTRLNEARVKALTGRDPITARFLHHEFFTFQPVAKFWLATNKKPIVRDDSQGFWRRLHLIPFSRTFERPDKTLKDRLRAEAPGILSWVVKGCLEWQRDGLNPPELVLKATDEYRRESDSLTPFYESCCVIDPRARVQASTLFARYQRWCSETRVWPEQQLNQTAFGKQVRSRFAVEEKRWTFYVGIGIRDDQQVVPF
jgi:putative DNA primase/helicase